MDREISLRRSENGIARLITRGKNRLVRLGPKGVENGQKFYSNKPQSQRGKNLASDRLELRINDIFSVLENSHRSQRYEQKTEMKKILNRKYLRLRCEFFKTEKKLVNPELQPVILNTINPIFGTKNVSALQWIFNFSLRDF